jgi:GTP-binding protein
VFRDECLIEVIAGKGGDGLASFRHEKYAPMGGPNGGDGGNGGSVILRATDQVTSLLGVGRKPRYVASGGEPGGPSKRYGHGGENKIIEVPVGTQVFDLEHGNMLRDLSIQDAELVIAAGGRGGRGNACFANSIRQAPKTAENGRRGEQRKVRLELKLFAEVGLLGLPNAGKSTFLSASSKATPKIADYPFTTLTPQVGICPVGNFETLVVADLPGLIEGAAGGAGLGHRFLKHVERCRVLLQFVDVSSAANTEPLEAFRVIAAELENYSPELALRPRLVVATKVEDPDSEERASELESAVGRPVLRISSVSGAGVRALLNQAHALVLKDKE